MIASKLIENDCCGTTCDKADIISKVKDLEETNQALDNKIMDLESMWDKHKEDFSKSCFDAGRESAFSYPTNGQKAWLNFKMTGL